MAAWTCTACHVHNPAHARACEGCGEDRAARPAPADPKPRRCVIDGAALEADGYCHAGAGYPVSFACPFACPLCRKPLTWDGGCEACHGTSTGRREDWAFPGDRYELEDGHWRKILAGPRPACSPEENAQAARIMAGLLATMPPLVSAPRRSRATGPAAVEEL
jgi:hypothetical protein